MRVRFGIKEDNQWLSGKYYKDGLSLRHSENLSEDRSHGEQTQLRVSQK
jgi:hypothetical protein